MASMDDRLARAWLHALYTPGLRPTRLRAALAESGGDIHAALDRLAGADDLGPAARAWLDAPDRRRIDADLAWLDAASCRLLCCTDADFPPLPEPLAQPPAALFVRGDAATLLLPQVAIVGARGATAAGLAHARRFARAIAEAGFVVTSGLADGIDGAAHGATLAAGTRTVAVVGTGLDRSYPRHHAALAERIAGQGALVSEFAPGSPPRADHFPRRNRLIAGLALGTLVIEAGTRSGSLITARLAAELGREVFALPGSIDNPMAAGCHRLIRDGARLVESPQEVVEALLPAVRALGHALAGRLAATAVEDNAATGAVAPSRQIADPAAARVQAALGHGIATLDELVARTGLEVAALAPLLLALELEGRLAPLAGSRYQALGG